MNAHDLELLARKFPLSESTRKRNSGMDMPKVGPPVKTVKEAQAILRAQKIEREFIEVLTAEQKLNLTEKRYLSILRTNGYDFIGIQMITLRLGWDLRYTPDFFTMTNGAITMHEVKGSHIWEDSLIKIKTAAAMFPWWRFVLAQWKDGQWTEKVIRP